jgi:hypothetical protein
MHKHPTYEDMVQDTSSHPTDSFVLPDIMATQIRSTHQVSRFDNDTYLGLNTKQYNIRKTSKASRDS